MAPVRWQSFWNITLAGLRSVSTTVILLGSIWTFNLFVGHLLHRPAAGPAGKTKILVTYTYNVFTQGQLRDRRHLRRASSSASCSCSAASTGA